MLRCTMLFLVAFLTANPAVAATWADKLFDNTYRDFGSVPRGPTLSHPFRLTNNTKNNVHISSIRVSCGCVTASVTQQTIEPGQSGAVVVKMDTTRFTGSKTVTIYIQFSQPGWEEGRIVVHADSRDDVTLTPDSLSFGQVKKGTAPNQTMTVTLLGNSPWKITEVKPESNYVKPEVKELRRTSSEVVYQVTANIRGDCPVGKWYTDIWLKTNNAAMPRVRIPVTVEIENPLSVSPATAQLGEVKVGDTAERKVIVRGVKPFKIKEIRGTDGEIAVGELPEEAKQLHVVTIKLQGTKAGERKWKLQVVTDLPEDNIVEFEAKGVVLPNLSKAESVRR